jgi:hypothetical protein
MRCNWDTSVCFLHPVEIITDTWSLHHHHKFIILLYVRSWNYERLHIETRVDRSSSTVHTDSTPRYKERVKWSFAVNMRPCISVSLGRHVEMEPSVRTRFTIRQEIAECWHTWFFLTKFCVMCCREVGSSVTRSDTNFGISYGFARN